MKIAYLLAALLPMVLGQCEIGWVHNKGQCYAFSEEALTWFDSAASCSYYGARLVQIETADENEWLTKQIIAKSMGSTWIGGSSRFHKSQWEWVPSLRPLSRYENWATGEPNNPQGEQCLEMRQDRNYLWNDLTCNTAQKFICEKSPKAGVTS